jgi:hypothetical protein
MVVAVVVQVVAAAVLVVVFNAIENMATRTISPENLNISNSWITQWHP